MELHIRVTETNDGKFKVDTIVDPPEPGSLEPRNWEEFGTFASVDEAAQKAREEILYQMDVVGPVRRKQKQDAANEPAIYDLVWKGRFIIDMSGQVDLPPDRQGLEGPDDADARMRFLSLMNDAVPQKVLFGAIKEKIRSGEIHTRERNEVTLYDADHEGTHFRITGNSNASHGYFYAEARIIRPEVNDE